MSGSLASCWQIERARALFPQSWWLALGAGEVVLFMPAVFNAAEEPSAKVFDWDDGFVVV